MWQRFLVRRHFGHIYHYRKPIFHFSSENDHLLLPRVIFAYVIAKNSPKYNFIPSLSLNDDMKRKERAVSFGRFGNNM